MKQKILLRGLRGLFMCCQVPHGPSPAHGLAPKGSWTVKWVEVAVEGAASVVQGAFAILPHPTSSSNYLLTQIFYDSTPFGIQDIIRQILS